MNVHYHENHKFYTLYFCALFERGSKNERMNERKNEGGIVLSASCGNLDFTLDECTSGA